MAFSLVYFWSFEDGGTLECDSTVSVTSSTAVRADAEGNYCAELTTATGYFQLKTDNWVADTYSTSVRYLGFWYKTNMDPYTDQKDYLILSTYNKAGASLNFRLWSNPMNGLSFEYNAATQNFTENITTPYFALFDNNWHFVEIMWDNDDRLAVWIDDKKLHDVTVTGSQSLSTEGGTFRFGSDGPATHTTLVDDVVFGTVTSWATAEADRLRNFNVASCYSTTSPTTGGDTLDGGAWTNTQVRPHDGTYAEYIVSGITDTLAPDSIAVQTNLTGSVTDIDDDPDNPDANWLDATGSSTLRVTFPTPSGNPKTGAGLQEFRVLMRKSATGPSGTGSEDVLPNGLGGSDSNLTGTAATIDDDPAAPGGDWRTASSNNSDSVCHALFATPTGGNPSGTQTFEIYARLTANGTACSYSVDLYEGGTLVTNVGSGTLSSTTGQYISHTWNASSLGTADGSAVECVFTVTKSGGSPTNRTTGEVDAVRWVASTTVTETQPGYSVQLYENGSAVGAAGSATGNLTDAGGDTVVSFTWDATNLGTADGSLVECYVNQTSGADRYIDIGAVEWICETTAYDTPKSGWIQQDGSPSAGPNGRSLTGILGMKSGMRFQRTIEATSVDFYRGNSVDGLTVYSSTPQTTTDVIALDTAGTIVPTASEYSRIGFGFTKDALDADNDYLRAQSLFVDIGMTGKKSAYHLGTEPNQWALEMFSQASTQEGWTTATDVSTVWTNPNNALDGYTTSADTTTAGTFLTNYLELSGLDNKSTIDSTYSAADWHPAKFGMTARALATAQGTVFTHVALDLDGTNQVEVSYSGTSANYPPWNATELNSWTVSEVTSATMRVWGSGTITTARLYYVQSELSLRKETYLITGAAVDFSVTAGVQDLQTVAGSYSHTGSAADFLLDVVIPTVAGSYATTGSAAALSRMKQLDLVAGSYSVTGSDVAFATANTLQTVTGSYATSGVNPALLFDHTLDTVTGSYATSGVAADFQKGFILGTGFPSTDTLDFQNATETGGGGVWTSETSAIDGSTATYAFTSTEGVANSSSDYAYVLYLYNPTSGGQLNNNGVDLVRFRVYSLTTGTGTPSARVLALWKPYTTAPLAEWITLGTWNIEQGTPGWSGYYTITKPDSGWGKLNDFVNQSKFRLMIAGQDPTGTLTECRIYEVDLELHSARENYTISASPVKLKAGRNLDTVTGTYATTGSDPALTVTHVYSLQTVAGSYSHTGSAADWVYSKVLSAQAGSYALTGENPVLAKLGNYPIGCATGSYAVTGSAMGFSRDLVMTAGVIGNYDTWQNTAGQAAGSPWSNITNAADGSTATYASTTLEGDVTIPTNWLRLDGNEWTDFPGGYYVQRVYVRVYHSVNGTGAPYLGLRIIQNAVTLKYIYLSATTPGWSQWEEIPAPAGGWGLDGDLQSAGDIRLYFAAEDAVGTITEARVYKSELRFERLLHDYRLTGKPSQYRWGRTIDTSAGSYATTGADATLTKQYVLGTTGGLFAYNHTGSAADLIADHTLNTEIGSYSVTGADAYFPQAFDLNLAAGSYTYTGSAAVLTKGMFMLGQSGSYSHTGSAASFTTSFTLQAQSGSYAVTGWDPGFSGIEIMPVDAGSYSVSGSDVAFEMSLVVATAEGSYLVSGQTTGLNKMRSIKGASGVYSVTGNDVRFTISGSSSRRIIMIG